MMDNTSSWFLREKLKEVVLKEEKLLWQDPKRCKSMLLDLTNNEYPLEVDLLVVVLNELTLNKKTVDAILDSTKKSYLLDIRNRFAYTLYNERTTAKDLALWSIDSWAYALGKFSEEDINQFSEYGLPSESEQAGPGTSNQENEKRPVSPSNESEQTGSKPSNQKDKKTQTSSLNESEQAGPTAQKEKASITVGINEQYQKIGQALFHAQAGDIIRVKAGTYNENIVIEKYVEIRAENPEETVVIQNDTGNNCISIRATKTNGRMQQHIIEAIKISNITIKQQGPRKSAIEISKGEVIVDNCIITSNSNRCIRIRNKTTSVSFRKCTISYTNQDKSIGVEIIQGSQALIEDTRIDEKSSESREPTYYTSSKGLLINNAACHVSEGSQINYLSGHGVVIESWANGDLQDCKITAIPEPTSSTTCVGVEIRENGVAKLDWCTISGAERGNHWSDKATFTCGVLVDGCEKVTLENCWIENSKQENIKIISGKNISIVDSHCMNANLSGIFIQEKGEVTIKSCEVSDSKKAGISIERGKADIEDCEIYNNEGHGISIEQGPHRISLKTCTCHHNQDGIYVSSDQQNSVETSIENCALFENFATGIKVVEQASVTIEQCFIRRSGRGILWGSQGVGKIIAGIVKENSYAGLETCKGELVLKDMKIEENYNYGIFWTNKSHGEIDGCMIRNNRNAPWEIEEGSNVILKNNTL